MKYSSDKNDWKKFEKKNVNSKKKLILFQNII